MKLLSKQQRRIFQLMIVAVVVLWIDHNVYLSTSTMSVLSSYYYDKHNHSNTSAAVNGDETSIPAWSDNSSFVMSSPAGMDLEQTVLPLHSSSSVSYRLYRNQTYTLRFVEDFNCLGEREALDAELRQTLVFRTEIDTNLNILLMGDSVGVQMAQGLLEAAQVVDKVLHRASWKMRNTGKVYDGLHSGVTNHQGLIAGWRILNFWRPAREGGPMPNQPGGGWRREDVTVLRNTAQATNNRSDFDVLIFRPPQPWMKWDDFRETALLETIALARDLLGIRLVIFLTVSYSNNVVTIEDIAHMRRVNDLIRSVGEQNNRNNTGSTGDSNNSSGTVTTVLTLEAGHLIDLTILHNSRRLGLPNVTEDNWNFTLPRAKILTQNVWVGGSVSYLCGRPVEIVNNEPTCMGNLLTNDGQHLCVTTMGGRLNAGLACLMVCGTNTNRSEKNDNDDTSLLLLAQCQDRCNRQFMSLEPIPEALFAPASAAATSTSPAAVPPVPNSSGITQRQ